MKFSNAQLAQNIKTILNEVVIPALSSPEALAATSGVIAAVEEIQKRDGDRSTILVQVLEEGAEIANTFANMLVVNQLTCDIDKPELVETTDLALQSRYFNQLIAYLEAVGKVLLNVDVKGEEEKQENMLDTLAKAASWELSWFKQQAAPLAEEPTITPATPLNVEKLTRFLVTCLPQGSQFDVKDFKRIPGGMSKQTYFFTLDSGGESQQLVVRKSNDSQLLDLGCLNIEREYHLLKAVFETGFPCPEPLWFAANPHDTDGSYFIMRRSPGGILGTFMGSDQPIPEALLLHLAELFAQLHSIPVSKLESDIGKFSEPRYLGASVEEALVYNLEGFIDFWEKLERDPSPFEVHTLAWLKTNVPSNPRPAAITHNDLLIHNFLAEDNRITAVLDWEGAVIGDPASDLGYVKAEVSKHMDWQKFMAHYQACGGQEIDESSFAYHETLTNLRNLAGTNKHTTTIKKGQGEAKDLLLAFNYVPAFMRAIARNVGLE